MSKHTKGPWVAVYMPEDGGDYVITGEIGICVAISIGGTSAEQANSRLIAAAPELYDELVQADAQMQMAYECVEAGRYDEALLHLGALSRTRRAAIAKARGEA